MDSDRDNDVQILRENYDYTLGKDEEPIRGVKRNSSMSLDRVGSLVKTNSRHIRGSGAPQSKDITPEKEYDLPIHDSL